MKTKKPTVCPECKVIFFARDLGYKKCPNCYENDKEKAILNLVFNSALDEYNRRIKEELKRGVKRNNVFPLDWAFDGIDKIKEEMRK